MSPTASGRGRGLALLLLSGLIPGVALADVAAEWWLPREASEALLDAVGGEAETLLNMTSTADCLIGQRLQDLEALNSEMAILSVSGGLLGRSLEERALTTQALLAIALAAPRTTETLQ